MKRLFYLGLLLLTSSTFANDTAKTETNESLKDQRVATQFLSVAKSKVGESTSYSFIDRTTLKTHPFNDKIRTFTQVINYDPALETMIDNEPVSYRSMLTHFNVNCDKKELGKETMLTYSNHFGDGHLVTENNLPQRWELIRKGHPDYSMLIIACSLPIQN